MCARFQIYSEEEIIEMREIINEVSKKFGNGAVSTGEIAPTNFAPILMMDGNRLAPSPASFGFPKWDGSGVLINARSESALEKPMFSKPLLTRRCVIPSVGFYEWAYESMVTLEQQMTMFQTENKPPAKEPKVKLFFRRPDEPMLYMAGMVNTFKDKSGHEQDSFVVLTTDAKHAIARFHDRMPVIITADEREEWLTSETFMREVLTREGSELEWRKAG